ncbi:Ig-like domain-containing protein [Paenibacillus sp. MMS20-IR301]|uniref:Ig-like domain-containing protein n=1 Tax=Paenibacillus sp. MMS20-IR301 TaxID=2895946 RepID=UPI0028E9E7CC|nr:Ig-like domain-containing protein [Paenibacillus sp. MMS20-IR301]WNS46932.1 Ig-like domain-containing protein [Paenibacillus sp. MMS20-IR301]
MSRSLKKYISMLLMISVLLTGAFPAYALPVEPAPAAWEKLNSLPGGDNVSAIASGGTDNATLVAVGEDGVVATASSTSVWTIHSSGVTENLNDVIYTGSQFIAVGDKGTIITSDDGTVWTNQTMSAVPNLNGIAYDPKGLVAVGDSGTIVTSSDGVVWKEVTDSKTSKSLYAVAYGNGKYVAVGADGAIVTSIDRAEWSVPASSKTTNSLYGITFGGGIFLAVGASGTVVTSPDTTKAAKIADIPAVNLNGVAYGNSAFMAAGDNGTALYSENQGQKWSTETTGVTSKLNGIGYISSLEQFIAAGNSGVVILSNPVVNAPKVIGRSPEPSEQGVEVDANLIISFNQKIKKTTTDANIFIYKASDLSTPVETIPVSDSKVAVKNNEVTINPQKDLAGDTDYEIQVDSNAFYDEGLKVGSSAINNGSWTFKTVKASDTTVPTVSTYFPENGATGVARDAKLVLTFNKEVFEGNGNIEIYNSTDNSVPQSINVAFSNVAIDKNTVTITPYDQLEYGDDYYVNIDAGAFEDAAGHKFAGITDNETWQFTVVEEPDMTPPTVSALSPVPGTKDVAVDTNLILTFDENVVAAKGDIVIYYSASDTIADTISAKDVIVDENKATITPSKELDYSTGYYVRIEAGAFKDTAGNSYAGLTGQPSEIPWHFTTINEPDKTAPEVSTYSPDNGVKDVSVSTDLVVTFNENVVAAKGNIEIYNSATDTKVDTIAAKDVTILNNTAAKIIPTKALEYGTSYYVLITSDAFKDTAGNSFAGISDSTAWKFTTLAEPDTTAPTLSAFSPEPGAKGVPVETGLTLTFSEKVTAAAGNIIVIYNSATDKPAAAITAKDLTIQDAVVTINPVGGLGYDTTYYVKIGSAAFKDMSGNSYAGIADSKAWQFTTTAVPDRTSPTVSTYSPESWATEVAINANLVLTFSENVQAAAGSIGIFKSTDEVNPVVIIPASSDYVTIRNNVVTINPADNLEHGTNYFVRVTEGAFKDLAGNSFAGISGITAWRFMTTSLPDTTAPLVTAFSPVNHADNVPVSATLSITFNENVLPGDAEFVIMNAANDSAVATIKAGDTARVSITNATVSISTTGLLAQGANYYVVIQPGALKDEAGNSFAGFADKGVWSFTTVPAPVTPNPGAPSSGSSAPAGSGTPSSSTETISANVGNGSAQGSTVSVDITRTKDANSVKKDAIALASDKVLQIINALKATGSNIATILIPDTNDEVAETRLTIPAASSKQLADNRVGLDIFTVNAEVKVPAGSLADFAQEIYFHLVPLKTEQQAAEAEARAKNQIQSVTGGAIVTLMGRPVTIDTNLQNRPVTLVLPVNTASLTPAELQALTVFIEHSDGTKELVKGEIVSFGQAGKSGIQFTVNKFSTFTVVLAQNPKVEVKAYMTGYEDGTFKPGNSITRAEVASIIARTFSQIAGTSGAAYTDVAGHWAANAISQVSASGIMKGYADGSFKPNQTITRAEMAAILSRLITGAQGNTASFSDVAGHWAQAAVELTAQAGMITGYEDGTFRPNQPLTRAEAVTIINRALGIAPLTSAAPKWTDVPAQYWAFGSIQAASVDHTAE